MSPDAGSSQSDHGVDASVRAAVDAQVEGLYMKETIHCERKAIFDFTLVILAALGYPWLRLS